MNWTTKSGKVLEIDQMSSEHIQNTLHFLEKKYGEEFLSSLAMGNGELNQQIQYMKKVLAQRILDQYQREVLSEVSPVNPFEYI